MVDLTGAFSLSDCEGFHRAWISKSLPLGAENHQLLWLALHNTTAAPKLGYGHRLKKEQVKTLSLSHTHTHTNTLLQTLTNLL